MKFGKGKLESFFYPNANLLKLLKDPLVTYEKLNQASKSKKFQHFQKKKKLHLHISFGFSKIFFKVF